MYVSGCSDHILQRTPRPAALHTYHPSLASFQRIDAAVSAAQAGLDAPHLGVGAVAGDEESYDTFKDFMDAVIEGWHGYKPTDKHKIDIDANNTKLSAEQAAKFDQYVISTRIRAGRSIRGLPLPPGTNRAQRRKVSETWFTVTYLRRFGKISKITENRAHNIGFLSALRTWAQR